MNIAPTNPLIDLHRQVQAELQPYDQIEIVATFGAPQAEYAAVRKTCGLMDLPHRGILELRGRDRLPFLNNMVSNLTWDKTSKSGLAAGQGVYAFFLNLRGRIVADMNVIERGDRTLIEMDVRKVELLRSTWEKYLFTEQVRLRSMVGSLHPIALHGPGAMQVLRQASNGELADLVPLQSCDLRIGGADAVVWRDDPCGVPGLHLIVPTESAAAVWQELIGRFTPSPEPGRRPLRPVGWVAFNTARIEAGRPLLDIDFPAAAPDRPGAKLTGTEAQTDTEVAAVPGALPAETGQAERAVNYTKCYIGQEVVARMHARKQVARRIVGIRMSGEQLPIAGSKILDSSDGEIGMVTSSTPSPALSGAAIALGMVKRPHFEPGTSLRIPAEGAIHTGTVVELPFARPEP